MEKHKCSENCLEFRDITDGNFIVLQSKIRKARKVYRCIECDDAIPEGTMYERVKVRATEINGGGFHTFSTCMTCVSIRKDLMDTVFCFPYENGHDPEDYPIGMLSCYVAEDLDLLRKHFMFVQKCFGPELAASFLKYKEACGAEVHVPLVPPLVPPLGSQKALFLVPPSPYSRW